MRSGRYIGIAWMLLPATGHCLAQALTDPMQPPALVAPLKGDGTAAAPAGSALQSILLSKGRRIAVIDGKPMKIGDRIGEARIVAIGPASVTLREGGKTRELELLPDVEKSRSGRAESGASRGQSASGKGARTR